MKRVPAPTDLLTCRFLMRRAMQTEDDRKNPLEHYLGATIRELRQRHGLTIAQVCEQAGISRGMLSKTEKAQPSPGLDVLNRFAQALGVSMPPLFRNTTRPTAAPSS